MMHSWGLILLPLVGLGSPAPPAAAPASAGSPAADTVEVTINAVPGLKFDRVRFQVAPSTPVKLVFNNRDTEGDMDHNVVVTRPGARMQVVQAGMKVSADQNYVPRTPEVLVFTPLVKKGDSYVLRFTTPSEPGAYPYVCTFPGHGFLMYGVMYVGREMPALAQDENVPPTQRDAAEAAAPEGRRYPGLSYGVDALPAVSRTFMPESGPASIAVGLPGGESYNFDAGASYLRYAWSGGFVDNLAHWKGNGNAYATVHGEVYYRNAVGFPLRIGARDAAERVEFLGYRLVEGGLPEFRYSVDGAEVRERITARPDGPGLARTFRIDTREPVRVLTDGDAGVRFQASAGRWNGSVLELTAAQARQFTLTLVPGAAGAR